MAEQLNYQINVGGNASESVGSLKKQLREAQNEVAALSDKFGATSQQAIQAAKRAAELKDRIGDAKALTDAFNPDAKFKALSASLSGVAGGFAAVQGAVGLFGAESKELEKQLLKVQSALALSQGLQSVGESIDSFKQLGAVIKTQVVTAFSTLRGAIVATGIGALVVALGLVVANWDKVKKAVLNVIPGLSSAANAIGNIINKISDFIGITSEADRKAAKMISDNEARIKSGERFLELNGDKYDEYTRRKLQANQTYRENLDKLLKDEQLNETERNKFIKQARDKADREIEQADKDRSANAKKVQDDANKKAKQASTQRTKDIKEALAEQQRLEEEAEQRRREQDERESAAQKIQIDAFRSTLSQREQEVLRAEDELENKKATLIRAGNFDFEKIEEEHRLKLATINAKFDKEDEDKRLAAEAKKKEIDGLNKQRELETQQLLAITLEDKKKVELKKLEEEFKAKEELAIKNGENLVTLRALYKAKETDIEKKFNEEQKKLDESAKQSKLNTLNEVSSLLGSFATLAGQQTAASKALTLGQIGIDTASAISSLTRNSEANPTNAVTFGASGAIQFATGLIRILANVKKAKDLLFSSSKSSIPTISASAPTTGIAPIVPQQPQAITTNISQASINALGNSALKAYVLETDVTSNQKRVAAIKQRARFG